MREKIQLFIQRETVLVIALILAVISCFFVLPDKKYAEYIDWRTSEGCFCRSDSTLLFEQYAYYK